MRPYKQPKGKQAYKRLIKLFNIKIEKVEAYSAEASFVSEAYEEARKVEAPLIHWVPVGADTPCQVIMPDATVVEGIAESACKELKPDDMVQFERFGFARIDKVNVKTLDQAAEVEAEPSMLNQVCVDCS